MKINLNTERGSAFMLVLIIMVIVSIWIISLQELTSFGTRAESRRITMSETLASADASVERAWGHWKAMTANGSSLPTTEELEAEWTTINKTVSGLNEGITVDPDSLTLRQIDSLGRIMEPDQVADPTASIDVARGLMKRSVSYLASATATASAPLGQSTAPISMSVNRIFQKSDVPILQFLGFFDHTLFIHPGPNMTLGGRIHSNQRIYSQPGNGSTVNINAQVSGPESNPPVLKPDGSRRNHADIKRDIKALMAAGKTDEITGLFYGTMLDKDITGIDHTPNDDRTVFQGKRGSLADAYKYTATGKLYLFDPNDTEFKEYWGDNDGDGIDDNAWKDSNNPNINGGYRELVDRPDASRDDTLFIASKRFYNQANIKIVYDSNDIFERDWRGRIKEPNVIDPEKIDIYYKDMDRAEPKVPKNPTDAQKRAAVNDYMAKGDMDATTKQAIIDALTFQLKGFRDHWQQDDHTGSGSNLAVPKDSAGRNIDVMNIDMGKLKIAIEAWMDSDDKNAPDPKKGTVLYITDEAANPTTGAGRGKGIRLQNGKELPLGGITVATDLLGYVQGDYNTGKTTSYKPQDRPSAFIADNIRLLSNAWNDSNSTKSVNDRNASDTTFKLAMVMGDRFANEMETDTGGIHNFPRFLEKWSTNCRIEGAFVQLWQSQYMLRNYPSSHSTYYSPPTRLWDYANSYLFKSPPGTLDAVDYGRGRYWFSN